MRQKTLKVKQQVMHKTFPLIRLIGRGIISLIREWTHLDPALPSKGFCIDAPKKGNSVGEYFYLLLGLAIRIRDVALQRD